MLSQQMTAVAIGGRAVLIEGEPGTGKSSLALKLIDRGAVLIGDDSVMLEARGANLTVRPHPNTRGLIEVRNLGLVTVPVSDEAPASLVIRLVLTAPRFIDQADTITILGLDLPLVMLQTPSPNLAIKAELALCKFGSQPA